MRSTVLLSIIALAASSMASAGTTGALPSGAEVLARYETFLGGRAALAKVTTRTMRTRRIEKSNDAQEDELVRFSKRPMLSIMNHEGLDGSFIRYMNGCDAQGGWTGYGKGNDPAAPKPGRATTDGNCEQEQYYYGYLPLDAARLMQNVARLEVRQRVRIVPTDPGIEGTLAGGHGRDLVPAGARDAYLVLAVPSHPADGLVWLYFDAQTGALLRRADAGANATPDTPGMSARYTDFLQYRDVGDGTRAPFQFATTAGLALTRGITESIVDNQPLADDLFARPKDVAHASKGL